VDARPRAAAVLLLLLCAGPLLLTIRFFSDIRAGLTELLPPTAPSVRALEEVHARLGSQSRLAVIVESPDAPANRRFISELGERLKVRRLPEARLIQVGCFEECKWVRDHALLLMPQEKFDHLMDRIEDAVRRAKLRTTGLYVDIGDDSGPWKDVQDEIETEARSNDRFPNGYFESPDGRRVVMLISLAGSEVELEPSAKLLDATKEEVAAIRSKYPADLVVGYNGEVPNLIEEHDAILADLSLSSIIVFLLVGGVILLYFRSLRGLAAVLFALTPGLLFTFAIGRLTVHHLNSNTAFLGSIIAGNGINYPLLFLAYYRARPPTEPRALAIYGAGHQSFFGTLAASLTASAAYGGLAVSTFKGFSQFGWIGGVGMVTTWLFTFASMPIAIGLFNPPRGERASRTQITLLGFFSHRWWPGVAAAAFVAAAATGGLFGTRYALRHGLYEMDLRALRNRDSLRSGSASWDDRLAAVFGVWLNPVAGLVEKPEDRETLATNLRHTLVEGDSHVAERVETIQEFVLPEAEQARRIERLGNLWKSAAHIPREEIPERARPYLDSMAPGKMHPIAVDDVPPPLRLAFKETNGRVDRTVLLFPSLKINYNDARNIIRFADELQATPMPPEAVVGGGFLFMAEIIRLVRDEAPQVVLVVCLLVALVLSPLLLRRPLRIILVVTTVASVAILAQANMLAVGVQLNMLNFAAVPITIGVGADYVVNLLGAMDALNADARRACARMGGAIFLCSMTTVIGYVSLLIAQSGALRTFGWAAVLGEIMAVTTVLLVLPVLLARTLPKEAALSKAA
jgi:uncharacterized protein